MTSPEQMDGRRELVQAQSDLRRAESISSLHGVAIAGAIADARQAGYLKAIEDAAKVADGYHMTLAVEEVDEEPVQKMHEFAKQCYSIYWRRWCAGGVHFPPWDDLDWHTSLHIKEAIKTATPLIQAQVLRDIVNDFEEWEQVAKAVGSRKSEVHGYKNAAACVRVLAKETYGMDLTQGEGT